MKIKNKNKLVGCDVCGKQEIDTSSFPTLGGGHSFIIVSLKIDGQRSYFDFCSEKCLMDWANQRNPTTRENSINPPTN